MVDEMGKLPEKFPQSEVMMDVGGKREGGDSDEDSNGSRKRTKMKDLQSVLQSEGIATHDPENSKMEETEEHMDIIDTQSSQIVDKNADGYADPKLPEVAPKRLLAPCSGRSSSKPLDLNSELCTDENSGYNDAVVSLGASRKRSMAGKGKASFEHNNKSFKSSCLDLNTNNVATSANRDSFTFKPHNNPKTKASLECGRSTDRLEEKEALRKWMEMKQNGFMSPSYGGIPPAPAAPKQRGRKSKNEVLKQKMEQAKKEQVDRFAKIAAPSGLLNGLNPGIINHVRNSRQVHSIIQALVRSEKQESLKQGIEVKDTVRELPDNNAGHENLNRYGLRESSISYGVPSFNLEPESNLLGGNYLPQSSSVFQLERGGHRGPATEDRFLAQASVASHVKNHSEDDNLALKLSSSAMISESTSCVSNEESGNGTSVDTLSVKAATVASQWLQLLQQDIKGRLAALRRSKKRVQAVITTELPFLLSKEFKLNQENDPHITYDPVSGRSGKAAAELHQAQWNKLFSQMDNSLAEEEKQLDCWLNEVDQMLQVCDQGLQHVQWNKLFEMQCLGGLNNDFRSKTIDPEKDLSVRAAAACIYSTGNFVNCC